MANRLNLPRRRLYAYLAIAAVAAAVVSLFFSDRGSVLPAIVWTVLGVDALRFSFKIYRDRRKDAALLADDSTPEGVYVRAHVRRELVRAIGQALFVLVGLGSLLIMRFVASVAFQLAFGKFFTASFLYVQFLMWLNSRLDSSLSERMRIAREVHEYEVRAKREKGA